MYEYDEECLKSFLEKQLQLFDEPVAETLEEAEAFLEAVSYTHLTLPTTPVACRSRWSPYH